MFDERVLPRYFTAVVGESGPWFQYNGAFILYENDAVARPADGCIHVGLGDFAHV